MIPTSNLANLLLQTARRLPDAPGLVWRDRIWNWAELAARASAAASALRAQGVRRGDRVLVHARNSNALFESCWACWLIGAVWVPTNFRLSPPEVAFLAANAECRAHVFDLAFPEHRAAAAAENAACVLEVAIGDHGGLSWDGLVEAGRGAPATEAEAVDRDHPAWLFYTSGTTGRPKGGTLTHGQMVFVVVNHIADLMPGLSAKDASLVVAPLSHGAGIHALAQVARGAVSVLMPGERLDVAEAWRLVAHHRVTNMFTVPTILNALCNDASVDAVDHASLRHVIYAGAPMYREDQKNALRKLGPCLVQYFGLGEVTGNITVLPPEWHSLADDPAMPIGSCGYPRTGMDVGILDADHRRLGAGETGEICVRGPAVMAGYFGNAAADEKAFAGGWFHTGDLGYLDARGFLYITGRQSDMYISGGSNVYPREVEEALLTHPAVAEACVVGVPHEKWGEAGVAVLVPRDGAAIDADAVMAHLDGRLGRYKWPSRIVVWDALPRSGYGKVPKNEVKRLLAGRDAGRQ
ncbi:AMP-binding protein [Roseomonas terrae]|jgi:fatty-acyl-CoA synthase|uniref:AMP-binding protein n=1 Tax=Neoroseomonas terrae TaxID=424799 RepID=A0ABS5EMH7_9PROT|nr:acyl-CoA synthetase [Neoroseomonas terrae]MBR0652234.1 AMP-binding protein [Neoroseomonas terrae]